MTSDSYQTKQLSTTADDCQKAAKMLRQGEVVAFPTETVYGLGANALDAKAVNRIYEAKGRPSDNPLIIHIAHRRQLADVVREIPPIAEQLMDAFWPGPLTIIMKKAPAVPDNVSAGLDTVGVRLPDHSVALNLLEKADVPIAAPSANRSGRPSPTTADHVLDDLNGRIAAVVDGGPTGVGVESTVIDVTVEPPMILRPGGVTQEQIELVVGRVQVDKSLLGTSDSTPRSPGMKYTHYAPQGDMWLVQGPLPAVIDYIQNRTDQDLEQGLRVGILTTDEGHAHYHADVVIACGSRDDLASVAAELYGTLREFDRQGVQRIYAETFPVSGMGQAVMNRLLKAAGNQVVSLPESSHTHGKEDETSRE